MSKRSKETITMTLPKEAAEAFEEKFGMSHRRLQIEKIVEETDSKITFKITGPYSEPDGFNGSILKQKVEAGTKAAGIGWPIMRSNKT